MVSGHCASWLSAMSCALHSSSCSSARLQRSLRRALVRCLCGCWRCLIFCDLALCGLLDSGFDVVGFLVVVVVVVVVVVRCDTSLSCPSLLKVMKSRVSMISLVISSCVMSIGGDELLMNNISLASGCWALGGRRTVGNSLMSHLEDILSLNVLVVIAAFAAERSQRLKSKIAAEYMKMFSNRRAVDNCVLEFCALKIEAISRP